MDTKPSEVIAFREAVKAVGSQSAMGRLLGVSQAAVWRWIRGSKAVPPEHVLTIEAATGISKHKLRPDIYPVEQVVAPTDLEPMR
jgi:DNA-binding transcriptional regulator YdaS (Cro superfamily)